MKNVVCWCCENFILQEDVLKNKEKIIDGICLYKNSFCYSEGEVCQEFILRRGLHTNRNIPDICKKYK